MYATCREVYGKILDPFDLLFDLLFDPAFGIHRFTQDAAALERAQNDAFGHPTRYVASVSLGVYDVCEPTGISLFVNLRLTYAHRSIPRIDAYRIAYANETFVWLCESHSFTSRVIVADTGLNLRLPVLPAYRSGAHALGYSLHPLHGRVFISFYG